MECFAPADALEHESGQFFGLTAGVGVAKRVKVADGHLGRVLFLQIFDFFGRGHVFPRLRLRGVDRS